MKLPRLRYCVPPVIAAGILLMGTATNANDGTPIAITGARIHTGEGTVHERGDVLIKGEKIVAVGANIRIPRNARIVSAGGRTITPGLIDVATSLGLVEIWAVRGSRDNYGSSNPIRAAFRAVDGFNPAAMVLPVARTGGITSVVSVPLGGVVAGQSLWADLTGRHARVIKESMALHVQLGARAGRSAGGSRAAAITMLRDLLNDARYYRREKKMYDENRMRELSAGKGDLEAAGRFLDGRGIVVLYANRAQDILAALRLAKRQGLRIAIVGGREAWRVARELGKADVPVILDPNDNIPYDFDSLGARADNAALLHRAGVRVVLSTFDAYSSRHRAQLLRFRAGNAVRAGLPRRVALKAVTLNPARAMGMDHLYGSLKAGKMANLVIWTGDPFETSTHAKAVYIRGEAVSLENRQKALLRRYLKLPPREID